MVLREMMVAVAVVHHFSRNICQRLVSALLAEQDEEWMTAKIYLNMKL